MRRREFITLVSGMVACPCLALAQQPEGIPRVVVMTGAAEATRDGRQGAAALRQGLRELGWTDGQNIRIDFHWSVGEAGRGEAAKEVVGVQPKVIVCSTSPVTAALLQLTRSIPIVFVNVTEPAAQGFVSSDAHPGGNVTGFRNFEPSMGGKWLEILTDIDPRIQRVAIMFNPETAAARGNFFLPSFHAAATAHGIQPIEVPLRDPTEIEPSLDAFAREAYGALVMMPDIFTGAQRKLIIRSALNHRLPVISAYRSYTEDGGLVSYGVSLSDLFYRATSYVDRILKGEKPGDLPVQAPTKFEMVINLETAKALGLKVPSGLITRADEIIE